MAFSKVKSGGQRDPPWGWVTLPSSIPIQRGTESAIQSFRLPTGLTAQLCA